MELLTVFLGVLVLAFLIGNALLFLVARKNRKKQSIGEIAQSDAARADSFTSQKTAVEVIVMEERLNLLNRRLENLEKEIFLAGKSRESPGNEEIFRKLEKLEEFRRNAHIEIEALKQRLDNLRKELNLAPDNVKTRFVSGVSKEKLHELVFNRAR